MGPVGPASERVPRGRRGATAGGRGAPWGHPRAGNKKKNGCRRPARTDADVGVDDDALAAGDGHGAGVRRRPPEWSCRAFAPRTTAARPAAMATDLVAVLRSYVVDRALASVRGPKALLLDAATTAAVSVAVSQTDILAREVYLTERIEGDRGEQLFHLKVRGWGGGCAAIPRGLRGARARPRARGRRRAIALHRPESRPLSFTVRRVSAADARKRGPHPARAARPPVWGVPPL